MLHRKKALCPRKWKSERRRKLLYPLQCHKYCHSKKGPQGRKVEKQEFSLKGPTDWFSTQEARVARIRKNRLSQTASLAWLHSRDSLSLPVSCHIAAEDMAAAANCSPTTLRGPGRKLGKAGWTGIYPGANLGQARFHAKWGSKTYPNADNFEIFKKSTKFNSNEWNVFVNKRPKKCSWQSSLKVLEEEHLKGTKSVSNKSPAFTSWTGDGSRHFWEPAWIFPTGNTHR